MKRLLKVFMFFALIFVLAGCSSLPNLEEAWTSISQDIPNEITESFALPNLGEDYEGVSITWASSNVDVLSNDGTVTQPIFDTVVDVVITLTNEEVSEPHTVSVTVKGMTAATRIQAAKDLLVVTDLDADLDFSDIESMYGVEISYVSSNTNVISDLGVITQNGLTQNAVLSFSITDALGADDLVEFNLDATVLPLSDAEQVNHVLSVLSDIDNITDDITLLGSIDNYTPVITWESSNAAVLSNAGVLNQPVDSLDITLTATVTLGSESQTKDIIAHVAGYTDVQRVESARDAFSISVTESSDDFTLPLTADYGTTVSWASNSDSVLIVGENAFVTRPTIQEEDATVTLTAQIEYQNAVVTKEFTVTIPKHTYTSSSLTQPTKTNYLLDEAIDLTGATLTFVLDDGSDYVVDVTESMIDSVDLSTTGEKLVTVTFLDETYTFNLYVFKDVVDQPIAIGEFVEEDFTDTYNPALSFDYSQVPNSGMIDEAAGALSGNSLYLESNGDYQGLFINGGVAYEANETYRITFDYKVLSFNDTLYFQLNGGPSGNLFTQFGSVAQVGSWQEFSYVVTLADTSDYLIQIFPGGAVGTTSLIIDNIKIEHIVSEPAKTVVGEIEINDYVIDTFGDTVNAPFSYDLSPTPNSGIIGPTEGSIDGNSLYVESPGSFTCIYLNENFTYTPEATYRITFDYKVLELADTIYFQLNGGAAGNLFTQFGLPEQVGTEQTFTWDVTLADTSDYIIQIFPGGAATPTRVIIDNLRIERITGETSVMVSGQLSEGDFVLDTFGDSVNAPFTLDLTPTPNSLVVSSSDLDYNALYFESPGSYTGIYLNENFEYTPNATYRITFDYKITALVDTVYFQLTSPIGNQFTQFGVLGEVGTVQTFTWDVTLGDSNDYIIQVFTGAGSGTTSIYIDNLKIERLAVEQSTTTVGELAIGESVVMSFGDPLNEPFTLDLTPTPNSSIITDSSLDGCALNYESPGTYTGIYLNENFTYTPNATYRITFTYHVVSFVDTLYFQLTSPVGNQFAQFGALGEVGTTQTFTWDVTLGDSSDYIIQIFPGGGSGTTNIIIDNLIVERIA